MYHRSNSSSNIPLPRANLFGSKQPNISKPSAPRRSQSTSRLSQRDSVTSQLRSQRPSSLDRKSSTVGLLRITPLHKPGARSGSFPKTTPTSALSQRTNSSRGTTPASCRKDHVTIQKLANDKKWVAEQYIKVQNFITASKLFDLSVVNASNIKPPSINNFMYVTGVLLMEIFPRITINKENYKEVIPAKLKLLRYPGTLTNSVLKTVNTMHSWPQVIGMWSWLIDKVNLSNGWGERSLVDHLEPDEKTRFHLRQNVLDFFTRRYKIFNSGCTEEIEEANNIYVKNLAELLEVDFEKSKQLQEEIDKMKAYLNKQVQENETLQAEKTKIETEIEEMQKKIKQFEENDPIEEAELDNELQLIQNNIQDYREGIDCAKSNIAALQEAIKTQPCTYEEKMSLLKQTEQLRADIEQKREKIEHAREIKNKFDHKLSTDITKIRSLVIEWNRSLLEVSIRKPHLKKLLLREKGFHDPNFLKELQEVSDYRDKVEKEVVEVLNEVEHDLKEKEQKKRQADKEIEELGEIIRRTNQDCVGVNEKIREFSAEIEKVAKDLEAMRAAHAQQSYKLQNLDNLETQIKTMAELKEKRDRLDAEVKKFGPKMLSFFVEMHNQVITNLKEMESIKDELATKIESKCLNLVEKQQQVIEALKSTKS